MGVQHSHFFNLAPTLGKVKSSISHGACRIHLNFVLLFSKIKVCHHLPYPLLGFLSNASLSSLTSLNSRKILQELLV
jgi:hypothetical protein